MKLLIVDDNNIHIKTIVRFINDPSYNINEIETATNGAEAFEKFLKFQPDIVITDVVMPVMDGIEFTQKIRNLGYQTQILFMSCYDEFDYIKAAIDNEVSSFIIKPVTKEDLINKIEHSIIKIKEVRKQEELDRIFNESLTVFQENFFKSLLYSSNINYDEMQVHINNLSLNQYTSYLIAKFYLVSTEKNNAIITNIYQIFQSIKNNIGMMSLATLEENSIVVLFMGNIEHKSFLEKTRHKISIFLNTYYSEDIIRVGLSQPYDSILFAKTMLNQATDALENNFADEADEIYTYDSSGFNDNLMQIPQITEQLRIIIENNDTEKIDEFLNTYYDSNKNSNASKYLCSIVLTIIQLILFEKNKSITELFGNYAVGWNKIDSFDTIVDVKQWTRNLILFSCDILKTDRLSNYEKIAADIIQRINESYTTISNIDNLISDLSISPNYAKSIFKKVTGKTIFEYIMMKKVEEAKKILLDPYVKVYEVSTMLGYKSNAHFLDIFKRYTGLTPKKYQQSMIEGKY